MIVDNTAMPGDGAENSRLVSPMIQEVSSQCIMEFSYYLSGLGRYFNVPQNIETNLKLALKNF